jgi:hypothetical protein
MRTIIKRKLEWLYQLQRKRKILGITIKEPILQKDL